MSKKVNELQVHQMITNPNQIKQDSSQIIDNNRLFNAPSGNILMHDTNILGHNHYYVSKKTKNALIYGINRSGAYQMLIKPTINNNSRANKKYQKSMIINDPSGKIYHDMSKKLNKRGYNVKVLNLRDSDSVYYNPLGLVVEDAYNFKPKDAKRDCDRVARVIFSSKLQGKNIHFYDYARNLFNYLVIHMIKQNRLNCKIKNDVIESITLPNVYEKLRNMVSKNKNCIGKILHTNDKMSGSIYSTFLNCLRFARVKSLSKANSPKNIIGVNKSFQNKQHPIAVFLETNPMHLGANKIASIYITQVVSQAIKHAYQRYDDKMLAHPLQIILAPTANLGAIDDLDIDLSIANSANISFILQFQNKEQVDLVYDYNSSANIIANCPLIYYVLSKSDKTLKDISDAVGKIRIMTIDKTIPKAKPKINTEPIMSVQKLEHFHHGEVIILRDGKKPIFTSNKYALPMK